MDDIDKRILDEYQNGFPLTERPYAALAHELGIDEDDVLARLGRLHEAGTISRIGAVVEPGKLGASTLAAVSVPAEEIEAAAAFLNGLPNVTHNYGREHPYNLWFVVTAPDEGERDDTLQAVENELSQRVLRLPLKQAFHLNLGFALSWN